MAVVKDCSTATKNIQLSTFHIVVYHFDHCLTHRIGTSVVMPPTPPHTDGIHMNREFGSMARYSRPSQTILEQQSPRRSKLY